MEKNNKQNIIIVILVTIIIILILIFIYVFTSGKFTSEKENLLSREEALTIGKALYDKVEEAYDVWILRPYCGISASKINDMPVISFADAATGKMNYYDSGFSSLEELKNYLRKYLSDAIIASKITKEEVTDISKLKDIAYNDYVLQDGNLYCRSISGKGFLSRYSGNYNIEVQEINKDKIIYNVTLEQVTQKAMEEGGDCWNIFLPSKDLDKCKSDEVEKKETTFTIEKKENNWIVTDYTFHD